MIPSQSSDKENDVQVKEEDGDSAIIISDSDLTPLKEKSPMKEKKKKLNTPPQKKPIKKQPLANNKKQPTLMTFFQKKGSKG